MFHSCGCPPQVAHTTTTTAWLPNSLGMRASQGCLRSQTPFDRWILGLGIHGCSKSMIACDPCMLARHGVAQTHGMRRDLATVKAIAGDSSFFNHTIRGAGSVHAGRSCRIPYFPCTSFTLRIFWKQPQFQHTVYGLVLEASECLPARTDGPWEHKNICPLARMGSGSVKRLPASTGGLWDRQHACPLTRMSPGDVKIFGTLIRHPFGPPYGNPRGVTSHIAYKT